MRRDRLSFLERNRRRVVAGVVAVGVVLLGAWIFTAGSRPAFACSSIFEPDAPAPTGQLGAVQDEQGGAHIGASETARYTECPPASGSMLNGRGIGPIETGYYGPGDRALPQGWVHNLEHGGLVVLYSCARGACDAPELEALRALSRQLDGQSPVCKTPAANTTVVARFDEMPRPYAALLWSRVLYMDTPDPAVINDFYAREAELLSDDATEFIVPPEATCTVPSASPPASPSPSASASPSASPSASAAPPGSASPSPSASASPSPSAS